MKFDPWNLDPKALYSISNDTEVKLIMLQLGVPDLFDGVPIPPKPERRFVAFDNHPTHWIIISRWTGVSEYSPNHKVHSLAQNAEANGLLFVAEPKSETNKKAFLKSLQGETEYLNASVPLSQLPDAGRS